ncbi:hypothetical protein Vretimale_1968 [Volvox reticuliferus]|uniref:Uncharacterized protein n=1 Tax=Volvox reticuliferus TaxID=1737510 RepID=A0A8J4C6G0_9CHLO|nr:hypothetical protein Vretifemale_4230 [Volvox reticuliferus]GIL96082.1 hypothetical protein Vretimale_1968 [Volvox reticuliferus]
MHMSVVPACLKGFAAISGLQCPCYLPPALGPCISLPSTYQFIASQRQQSNAVYHTVAGTVLRKHCYRDSPARALRRSSASPASCSLSVSGKWISGGGHRKALYRPSQYGHHYFRPGMMQRNLCNLNSKRVNGAPFQRCLRLRKKNRASLTSRA